MIRRRGDGVNRSMGMAEGHVDPVDQSDQLEQVDQLAPVVEQVLPDVGRDVHEVARHEHQAVLLHFG